MNKVIQNMKANPSSLLMLLIALAFPIVYLNLFSANFISWDDKDVLLANIDVHEFNLKAFFTKHYVGNYAPITMIVFAIDWLLFNGSAFWQHSFNLVFHFMNVLLVFKLVKLLLNDTYKAFLVCVIFCFHPTQIETVAWVAAKNNTIYALFFLAASIYYIKFCKENNKRFYVYAFILFVFSVLSKPSAICFPLCLFAIDYVLGKTFDKKLFLNKIPFLIVAFIIGLVTIYTRTEDKFLTNSHAYPIYERIGYAGYAIMQYFNKLFLPINLSVIYPYPQNKLLSMISGYALLIVMGFLIYKLYKTKKYTTLFGVAFFFINLVLVLQFIPFGEVLTADRYLYLPLVGIGISIVSLISVNQKQLKLISFILLFVLGALSFARTSVWKNSISLYSDILKKYPHSFVALNSLGAEYMLNKQYDPAMIYLNSAINENTNYYKGYYNRGLLYAQTNRYDRALNDFNKAIELNNYQKAYVARANVYYALKDFSKAIADAETVLKIDAANIKANFVMATCYDDLNQLDKALPFYNKAITKYTDEPLFFMRRGILYGKQQNFTGCLNDLNACTTLNPNFAEAYYWKGVVKVNLKQNPCADLRTAVNLGFTPAQQSISMYCR